MSDYDNNLSGALFKNDKKESERHPDYRGSCEINGTEFWISAWLKESKSGTKFMSLAFTPKDEQRAAPAVAETLDDDVPF
jgi:uncharacterized protein (DUF736 family)